MVSYIEHACETGPPPDVVANAFIGFKTGIAWSSLFSDVISSKNPFPISFKVPSPPNAIIFLNPFLINLLSR